MAGTEDVVAVDLRIIPLRVRPMPPVGKVRMGKVRMDRKDGLAVPENLARLAHNRQRSFPSPPIPEHREIE